MSAPSNPTASHFKVGSVHNFARVGMARVLKVQSFGTVDVESIATGNCYRITGLGPVLHTAHCEATFAAGAL